MQKHCFSTKHGGWGTSQNAMIVNNVYERVPAFQSYSKQVCTAVMSMCQSISDERPLYTTEVVGKHFKQCTFHFVPAQSYLLQFNISSGHVQLIFLWNVNVDGFSGCNTYNFYATSVYAYKLYYKSISKLNNFRCAQCVILSYYLKSTLCRYIFVYRNFDQGTL